MSHRSPYTTTLKDVLACFSEEERKLLCEWQNILYTNVMNEIHQALLSLGPVIAATIFSLQAEENEDLGHVDVQGPESVAISNEDALNKIMKEPEASLHTDSMKSSNVNPVLISIRLKEEEGTVTIFDQDAKEMQDLLYPTGFPSLAHESEVSYMNSTDGEGREDSRRASQAGQEALLMVMPVSIKEEEATDPTALMDHQERQDILGSAECEVPKILLLTSFKEEVTDSAGDQDSAEMHYISYPTGVPSLMSEPAVSYMHSIDGGGGVEGGGEGEEGTSRASPGNQNRRNTEEENCIRVKQEERLESGLLAQRMCCSDKTSPGAIQQLDDSNTGNRYRHTNKKKKEKCIQTLYGEEALPWEARETALQNSRKKRTDKRSNMPQREKTTTIRRTVRSTDCESGARKSENSTEQQQTNKLPVQCYTCPECGKVFTIHYKLTIHQRLAHRK